MKFEDKLIKLRKKASLSQEALAEKLDVTRQTISKWELGQTKPDMEKLAQMAKLFNISVNELVSDDELKEEKSETHIKKENKGERKIVLYILIIILIASFVTLVYRVGSDVSNKYQRDKKNKENIIKDISNKISDGIDNITNDDEKTKEEIEEEKQDKIDDFNMYYENHSGSETKFSVSSLIDKAVTNNKKNKDHLIEFIFDGKSFGTEASSIKEIKKSLTDFKGYDIQYYEVSLDYDKDGYINKITIETM